MANLGTYQLALFGVLVKYPSGRHFAAKAGTYLVLSPRMNSSTIALATSSGYCLMGCFMV
jgi:hypothetical protein